MTNETIPQKAARILEATKAGRLEMPYNDAAPLMYALKGDYTEAEAPQALEFVDYYLGQI